MKYTHGKCAFCIRASMFGILSLNVCNEITCMCIDNDAKRRLMEVLKKAEMTLLGDWGFHSKLNGTQSNYFIDLFCDFSGVFVEADMFREFTKILVYILPVCFY